MVATPGQGPDRPEEVAYTDVRVIGNGSFGVVYQAKLCQTAEIVAIKKVLQDKRFKVSMLARWYWIIVFVRGKGWAFEVEVFILGQFIDSYRAVTSGSVLRVF